MSNSAEFIRDVRNFEQMAGNRLHMLFRRCFEHAERSILDGSPVTGAPGQPIKSGDLYDSWERVGSFEALRIGVKSELYYAPIIEDNFRGATLRSPVGGFHSVKFTIAGWDRVVQHELAIIKRAQAAPEGRGSKMRDPKTGRFV